VPDILLPATPIRMPGVGAEEEVGAWSVGAEGGGEGEVLHSALAGALDSAVYGGDGTGTPSGEQ